MNYGISVLFRAIPLAMALFCFGYGAFISAYGDDSNRLVAGPVVFSLWYDLHCIIWQQPLLLSGKSYILTGEVLYMHCLLSVIWPLLSQLLAEFACLPDLPLPPLS